MFVRILSLATLMMCCAGLALHTPALSQNPAEGALGDAPSADKTYLGLHVGPVPKVLSMHLPEVLAADSGLLVFGIDPDSPAADAGLQSSDILVRFDGKNVSSNDQLIDHLDETKVGQTVELNLIRQGKPLVVHVKVVKRPANMVFGNRVFGNQAFGNPLGAWPQMPQLGAPNFGDPKFGAMPDMNGFADMQEQMEQMHNKIQKMHEEFHKGLGGMPAMPDLDPDDFSSWMRSSSSSHFTSISINKIDGDRYSANVKYKSDDGEARELNIEGTLDEIRSAADADENMPESVRKQLDRSLKMRDFAPFQNGQVSGDMSKMQEMMKQFNQGFDFDDVDLPKLPAGNLQRL